MTVPMIIFILVVFLTFYNNGIQSYIHFEGYPLLANVGKPEFPIYLKEYERRLTIPLLVPYALTLLSNLALVFARPASMPLIGVIAALILNLAVAIVTVRLATPIYNRIKQASEAAHEAMEQLLRINLLRLALSTLSSLVVLYLLLNQVAI